VFGEEEPTVKRRTSTVDSIAQIVGYNLALEFGNEGWPLMPMFPPDFEHGGKVSGG
jgi:hypothetical protein